MSLSDNGKATLTASQFTNHLLQLSIGIINNSNITSKNLSRKGLYLNESGSLRLEIIFLECIKKLWKNQRYTSIPEEDVVTICSTKNSISLTIKEKDKCPNVNLKWFREENLNRPIFGQFNINSVRNKFEFLASIITLFFL